ncbi:MAG: hypothetical protein QF701_13665 [Nitrospinota bacterium]|nr:hypothetical protein [Nitrospinota bacterium]MDP7369468.1 hypothetical protein [Nitrospinota bacterium]MDP7662483.1 hypothetical protein [Nitrospinota bacterium]
MGFKTMDGYDVDRRVFEEWRELVAVSTISWPENPQRCWAMWIGPGLSRMSISIWSLAADPAGMKMSLSVI